MTKITIATAIYQGLEQDLSFESEDLRRHFYIVGKTGSGKSTLLKTMMSQLIDEGAGFALLDPHGDLADEVLDLIHKSRREDVCYFSPGDPDYPVSLNLFANIPPERRAVYASGMVASFKAIWRDSWGPRMEYILYNTIAALLDCENVSMLSIGKMLTEEPYRNWVIKQIKDPAVKQFWEAEFSQYDVRFQREAVAPILNKIGPFLTNPLIRNCLGQVKRTVNFRDIMDSKKILIVNLSKGLIGENNANLLGSLLAGLIQFEALGRVDQREEDRIDFYLIMDEFHNFTTDAFASILSESRKYRLNLIMAHQYLDQLKDEVHKAVLGNVGTLLSFTIGNADAERLAPEFGEYASSAFVDLDRFKMICRPFQNGKVNPARFCFLNPYGFKSYRQKESIIRHSRNRYSAPRAEVEEKINRWYGMDEN